MLLYNTNFKNVRKLVNIMNLQIKKISPEDTRSLREKILRPGQPLDNLIYSGDYNPEAYHAGAFVDNNLIGIASVYLKAKDGEQRKDSWQLRGMAIDESMQGKDIGKQLLENCIEYIKSCNDKHLWCNARVKAIGFYKKMGFEITSDEFEIPEIGSHYIMEINLI